MYSQCSNINSSLMSNTENKLKSLLNSVLPESSDMSTTSSFFEVGGDSLSAGKKNDFFSISISISFYFFFIFSTIFYFILFFFINFIYTYIYISFIFIFVLFLIYF